jgi:hypothetical protein
MTMLETKIGTPVTKPEAADGRFFDTQRVAIPLLEEINAAAITAIVDIDESLLAFAGMHRSVTAFENTLSRVEPERIHIAAQHIAGILEAMLPRSYFSLARTNTYFMGEDPGRRSGNGNWLFLPTDRAYSVFTRPSISLLLDGTVELASIKDEAKLIDDTITHVQYAKMRQARLAEEQRAEESRQNNKALEDHIKKHSSKKPKPLQEKIDLSEKHKVMSPKPIQGALFYEAYKNFKTGEVMWNIDY